MLALMYFDLSQGSHTSLVLVEHGYKVTAIDNLDNAFEEVLNRLKKLAGDKADNLNFVKVQTSMLPAKPRKVGKTCADPQE